MYSLEYKSCLTEQRNRKEIETTHQNWSRPATHNYTRQTVCFIRKNKNTSIINNIVRLQKQQVYISFPWQLINLNVSNFEYRIFVVVLSAGTVEKIKRNIQNSTCPNQAIFKFSRFTCSSVLTVFVTFVYFFNA